MTETSAKSIAGAWLGLLFPPACLACEEGAAAPFQGGVCASCWKAIDVPRAAACAVCDLPIAAPGAARLSRPLCLRCLAAPPPFTALRCAAIYEGAARRVLQAYKFGRADYLAPHLARRMSRGLGELALADAVAPVPATRRERSRRGFFPAGELAREVARAIDRPFEELLAKSRETRRQVGLSARERRANVRGAFAARKCPRSVLLVDDVATSGATLAECSRALARAGARIIIGAAFARALPEGT